ncbi:amidohydrolase family protein [Frankia sp. Cr2]|uniref:amidohydrolase family protein n=1 Tax=Frankia sp. Cr2 TaxID=3073932 RepID=UPI002AD4A4A3|nr:amidohydrolase family protein [Frankia sp. Cr2]
MARTDEIFDGDNHFYEPRDSFTRHIEATYADRTFRTEIDAEGQDILLAAGRPVRLLDASIFDEVGRPGSLREMLLTMKTGGSVGDSYRMEPMRPEYQDRDARLAVMDAQRVQACLMFPSTALLAEHYLRETDLLYASLRAWNRWCAEEWGFAYQERIFSLPQLSLRDLDMAVDLLDWVLDNGAKAILLPTGPVYGRSPGDPYFDPFWARVNEAGVTVVYHISEPAMSYTERRSPDWGQQPEPTFYTQSAWQWTFTYGDQPVMETLAALVFDNLFARFPNIKVLSAEHGCEWVPPLLRRMDKMRGLGRNGPWVGGPLPARPSEIFLEHVRVTPYPEDDVTAVVQRLGPDLIVAGSDYPHPEGLAEPASFEQLLQNLPADQRRKLLRDNGLQLVGLATAPA